MTLYGLCFLAGALVMMLEMLGFRMLAPYFGYSTYVWGSLVGVVMGALAAGYLLGGHLADRVGGRPLLFGFLLAAGAWLAGLAPLYPGLLRSSQQAGLVAGALLASAVLFAAPMVLLASVSPYLVGILAREGRVGSTAGRIWAVSTTGSIVGTFLASFVLIPEAGSHATLLACAGLALAAGAGGFALAGRPAALLALALLALVPSRVPARSPGTVFSGESPYSHVAVVQSGEWLALKPEDAYIHSMYHPTRLLTGSEWDYYSLGPALAPGAREALVLGMGGGTSVRQLLHFWPGLRVTGVDVDPLVARVAFERFGLRDDPARLRVAVEDARLFLLGDPGRYAVIEVDLYRGGVFIPFHLASREFFAEVRRHLAPGGVVVMNVNVPAGPEEGPGPSMHGCVAATLREVFPSVYACRLPEASEMLFAFAEPVSGAELARRLAGGAPEALRPLARTAREALRPAEPGPGDFVLSDDRAPVERLCYPVAESYFRVATRRM